MYVCISMYSMHVCVCEHCQYMHKLLTKVKTFFYIENYFMKKPNERTIARGAVPTYINIHMFTYKETYIHMYMYISTCMCVYARR